MAALFATLVLVAAVCAVFGVCAFISDHILPRCRRRRNR